MVQIGQTFTWKSPSYTEAPTRNKTFAIGRRRILLWTTFYSFRVYPIGLGHEPFEKCNCPLSNCEIVTDHSLINTSDAVVFHFDSVKWYEMPKWRHQQQFWVFVSYEPPQNYERTYGLESYNMLFNLTATYRSDADIVVPFGKFVMSNSSRNKLPITKVSAPLGKANSKRKLALWIVSHCNASSGRDEYVRQLKEHVPIDVFGKCSDNASQRLCQKGSCDKALYRNYKFYLAFENSLCRDYITEKFFNALLNGIVPIVLGEVDYTKYAPPLSYIDVRDYKSPRHLADYLKVLDANDTLYNEYFMWTNNWKFQKGHRENKTFCQLCELLHRPQSAPKMYDIVEWYFGNGTCSTKHY